jgi:hypothetical protein
VAQRSADALAVGTGVHRAAQAAAALTIGSVVTLGIFYAIGEPWGTLNDGITIALAAATVPIAVGVARQSGAQPSSISVPSPMSPGQSPRSASRPC